MSLRELLLVLEPLVASKLDGELEHEWGQLQVGQGTGQCRNGTSQGRAENGWSEVGQG